MRRHGLAHTRCSIFIALSDDSLISVASRRECEYHFNASAHIRGSAMP